MGLIISAVDEIDRIRWAQPKKGRVIKARRVMFTDETTAIIELESGEFTVAGRRHSPNGNWAVLGYGIDQFTGAVLDGLVRLGILTKEQVSIHKKRESERRAKQDQKYARESLERACTTLGIPVPVLASSLPEEDNG